MALRHGREQTLTTSMGDVFMHLNDSGNRLSGTLVSRAAQSRIDLLRVTHPRIVPDQRSASGPFAEVEARPALVRYYLPTTDIAHLNGDVRKVSEADLD